LDEQRSLQERITADELLARILDAAARKKKPEDRLRRTTRDLRTRVANSTEVDIKTQFTLICLSLLPLTMHDDVFVHSNGAGPVNIQN
jgi:hypothetical protein